MTTENLRIKKIHTTKAIAEASGSIIDGQWFYCTDSQEVGIRNGSDFHYFGNNEYWKRTGTVIETVDDYDVIMRNCNGITVGDTKHLWSGNNSYLQLGIEGENIFSLFSDSNACGVYGHSFYVDDEWYNCSETGYSWALNFTSTKISISKGDSDTAGGGIAFGERYSFGNTETEVNADSFVITNSSSNITLDASGDGVSFGGAWVDSPVEIQLNDSTKIKFIGVVSGTVSPDYLQPTHVLKCAIEDDTEVYTRYIGLYNKA